MKVRDTETGLHTVCNLNDPNGRERKCDFRSEYIWVQESRGICQSAK